MGPKIIPDVVSEQTIRALTAEDTARDAAKMMVEVNISAVLVVVDGDCLVGIVTERDLSRRVVATDRRASETKLGEIMTADPVTVSPDDSAVEAMAEMDRLKIRHLPVVDEGRVVGVVSIRDLRSSISTHVVAV